MGFPVLDGSSQTNIATEHVYCPVVTFGAGTVSTHRGVKGLTVTRPTATTLVLTFDQPYAEITRFSVGTFCATGTALIAWAITTNAIATTGVVTLTAIDCNSAGTATAPAAADIAYITIGVSQDVLNDRFTSSTA